MHRVRGPAAQVAVDRAEVRIARIDAAPKVVDSRVGLSEEELPSAVEVLGDVLHHAGLARPGRAVD